MNLIDFLIGVILALAGIAGYYWGIVRQVLALAGLVAGIAVAGRYGSSAADALMSFVDDRAIAEIGGALILLALVGGTASLTASLLQMYVGLMIAGKADHGAGALLGIVHAALLVTALALIVQAHPVEPLQTALRGSALISVLTDNVGHVLMPLLNLNAG
ncbi:CvpA family protein [Roseiflexus sp.]|uniref:CvpA family protein n=1 Tax=Roseiflexus sp. TaxID=2562120 RepID=UPI00398ADFCC